MSKWKTAAAAIYDLLGLTKEQRKIVYRIFQRCEAANKRGEIYDGSQLTFFQEKSHVICTDGIEGQIIGNIMEKSGGNYRGTAEVLNCWHQRQGMDAVAHSTIKNHVDNFMKAKEVKTIKVQSGSSNLYSPWCQASFKWNKQLAIRFGTLDPYTVPDPPMPPPPPGTKEQWIQDYNNDKMEEQSRLNAFIAAENE